MAKRGLSKRRGRYDRSKYRAFIVLSQLGKYGRDGWLSTRELCLLAGLPYNSLTKLLVTWFRYEYVVRRPCTVWGRGDYEYKLDIHGKAWLEYADKRLYNRERFFNQLVEWYNYEVKPHYDELVSLPFKSLVGFVGHEAKRFY